MSASKTRSLDYETLSSVSKENGASEQASLEPLKSLKSEREVLRSLKNPSWKSKSSEAVKEPQPVTDKSERAEKVAVANIENLNQPPLSYAERQKQNKQQKSLEKDKRLLSRDRWQTHDGHTLTYAGIFLFTLTLYFRPYELIPALSSFSSMALIVAVATLLIYLPTQFSVEGSLTAFSTEIKCIIFLALWALLTIPIAKSPSLAWLTFNDSFNKVVLIFIVMVNTLRTQKRLKGLMWLSVSVGVLLGYQAIELYRQGLFKTEGYRISVDFGGMFGNPNDMAVHLVMFTPIAVALGIASKKKFSKLVYFVATAIMIGGNMVTQSRGGFLGLLATSAVLVWKLSKGQRFKGILISSVVGLIVIALAPGNYGLRVLSIFFPALDPLGSSDQRRELLQQSIIVTLRNPLGIGMGNFPLVGVRNLETHNAYTQVSSELGWLALAAYLILMISPMRKLAAVERRTYAQANFSWLYYLSIGVQVSIIGYMVSSFFAPVAYNWFVYYPIAYAICLRRIYQLGQTETDVAVERGSGLSDYFKLQKE